MNTEEFKPGIAYPLPQPEMKGVIVYYSTDGRGWGSLLAHSDKWWCIMPEIPKPKSQHETDEEFVMSNWESIAEKCCCKMHGIQDGIRAGINYARK